jgi:hypothetical protein
MIALDQVDSKNSLMVFIPTIRSDLQAAINISNLFEFSSMTKVSVLIGYGGDNLEYFNSIQIRADFYNSIGAKISLFNHTSLFKRFEWAFGHQKTWVLFVSDDDPFTTNHLESYRTFIESPLTDLTNVTSIIPNSYFITNHKDMICYKPVCYDDSSTEARIKKMLSTPYNGLRFWAAFRTESIRERITEAVKNRFMPSYFDQLLVYSACLEGISVRHEGVGGIFYDNVNWATYERANRSDLRSYEIPTMILFHEVLWLNDYIRLLGERTISEEFFRFLRSYCLNRIGHSLQSFHDRASMLLVSQTSTSQVIEQSFQSLVSIRTSLENCHSWSKVVELMTSRHRMGLAQYQDRGQVDC